MASPCNAPVCPKASSSSPSWRRRRLGGVQAGLAYFGVANQSCKRCVTRDVEPLPAVQESALDDISAEKTPRGPQRQFEDARGAKRRATLGKELIAERNYFLQPLVDRIGAVMLEVPAQ